jgi:hypothetical protein
MKHWILSLSNDSKACTQHHQHVYGDIAYVCLLDTADSDMAAVAVVAQLQRMCTAIRDVIHVWCQEAGDSMQCFFMTTYTYKLCLY